MPKAVFAGSFDPFTNGHLDIVQRGLALFDSITILLAENSQKQGKVPMSLRLEAIQKCFLHDPRVQVDYWTGLTVNYMKLHDIPILLRGVRNAQDLDWEQSIAWANGFIQKDVETVLLATKPEYRHLSSTMVREMLSHGVDISPLIPSAIIPYYLP